MFVLRHGRESLCAAVHAEIAGSMDESVNTHFKCFLVLLGTQGAGKTKGCAAFCRGRSGRTIAKARSLTWIAELGELEATLKNSDVAHKKALLAQSEDQIRALHACNASRYGRRTVFEWTVNDERVLVDETGNRRHLPISVGDVTINWSNEERDQLWAEAWSRDTVGERW